jgi:enediyne polyketide synthase
VELVVDVELSVNNDPYLNDHVFQGERVFPAVLGLEAMAQVAMALLETTELPIFEDVQFNRPVVVSESAPLKIRLAALVRGANQIEVVLRSEQTAFQVDHFRAICWVGKQVSGIGEQSKHVADIQDNKPHVSLNPEQDLYGEILFHSGRFQRLHGYRKLRATECLAEIAPATETNWFSRYLPGELVLGDPATRDAAIHALQACIPHATILPIGVDRLISSAVQSANLHFVYAKERSQIGDTFIYDLEVIGADGNVLEVWQGLRLQVVNQSAPERVWPEPLLGPYLERRIRELIPTTDLTVVVDRDANVERRVRSDRAIQQAIGSSMPLWRRLDGKPDAIGNCAVSAAHIGHITLVVAGAAPVSCDAELAVAKPADSWKNLLSSEQFALAGSIAQETGEDQDTAATCVWTARECLKKTGAMIDAPLVLISSTTDHWVLLSQGTLVIAMFIAQHTNTVNRLVLAVLARANNTSAYKG